MNYLIKLLYYFYYSNFKKKRRREVKSFSSCNAPIEGFGRMREVAKDVGVSTEELQEAFKRMASHKQNVGNYSDIFKRSKHG